MALLSSVVVSAVALWAMQAAAQTVDPLCGAGFGYVAAIQCGTDADAPVVLSCIPQPLVQDVCGLPKNTFASQLCSSQAGVMAEPVAVESLTGAHSTYSLPLQLQAPP